MAVEKTVAFKGRRPVRSKAVINYNIVEQINTLNYPACSICGTTLTNQNFMHTKFGECLLPRGSQSVIRR